MPTSASFVQHSLELLSGVGPVRSRPMFGGHGLSLNGISIGIIDDDRLYLRVDDLTRPQFEAAGAQPFTYPSKKGPMVMKSYWSLPDEAVDDPDVALKWGRLAEEASLRGEAAKRKAAPSASKAPVGKAAGKRAPSSPKAGQDKGAPSKSASKRAPLPAQGKAKSAAKTSTAKQRSAAGKAKSAVKTSAAKQRSAAGKAKSAAKTSAAR